MACEKLGGGTRDEGGGSVCTCELFPGEVLMVIVGRGLRGGVVDLVCGFGLCSYPLHNFSQ